MTDGLNSGTYYDIGNYRMFGWMAKVDPNMSPYSTVVQARDIEFTVAVLPSGPGGWTYITTYTHSGILYLNADYGNYPSPFAP